MIEPVSRPALRLISAAPPPHLLLPAPRRSAAPPAKAEPASRVPRARAGEMNVLGIAREIGMTDRPMRAIIQKIRLLVEKSGFPAPRTPRFVKGRRMSGGQAVDCKSKWDADEVEHWLDNDQPPPVAAQRTDRRVAATRAKMAEMALAVANG